MILLLSFAASSPSFFSVLRNKTITAEDSKHRAHKLLDSEKSWFYLYSDKEISRSNINIEYKASNVISKHWMSVFLNGSQADSLTKSGFLLRQLSPAEKFVQTNLPAEETEVLLIEASETFVAPKIDGLTFVNISPQSYRVFCKDFNKTIEMLCSIPEVSYVVRSRLPRASNIMGAGYTQYNTLAADKARYLNEHGLNGTGTIVGVTDTFLDTNSTFFYDPKYPGKLEHWKKYEDHRKIAIIIDSPASLGENTTYSFDAHGTHTSGTAVGSALDTSVSAYNGVATCAKLAFVQSNLDGGRVSFEYKSFLKIITEGAKVISNSWGIDINAKKDLAIVTADENYLQKMFPNNLFVFSVGNAGQRLNKKKNFYQTISYEASAKNVLSVGALDELSIYPDTPEKKIYFIIKNYPHYYEIELSNFSEESEAVNDIFAKTGNKFNITDKSPSSFSPEEHYEYIFYVKTEEELKKMSQNPPKRIITKFSIENFSFSEFKNNVFVGSVSESMALKIEENIAEAAKKGLYAPGSLYPNYRIGNRQKPALFSSKGPCMDGLLKPDVVAPGEVILSAASNPDAPLNHNDITVMSGTSMSTPNVAGACALVQQYFQDRGVNPTGALIRAVIINSADPLDGVTKYPNVESGFGQVNLGRYIPTDDKPNAKLIWRDNETINSDSHIVAEITVSDKSEPMRITMSYLDEVANVESSISIVVDLDLVVESPSHVIYRGNHREDDTEEKFSTNERVIINADELEVGTYKVHVFSNNYTKFWAIDPIKFSIVGFGSFDSTTFDFKAATECITCPLCSELSLECQPNKKWDCEGYVGHSCQSRTELFTPEDKEMSIPVSPLGIVYVYLMLPTSTDEFEDIEFYITPNDPYGASYTELWDMYSDVSQLDGFSSYGSIFKTAYDNHDHKYHPVPDSFVFLSMVMIKSNSPVNSSIKITSLFNRSIFVTPVAAQTPTAASMWTKSFGVAFGLAICFGIAFVVALFFCLRRSTKHKDDFTLTA